MKSTADLLRRKRRREIPYNMDKYNTTWKSFPCCSRGFHPNFQHRAPWKIYTNVWSSGDSLNWVLDWPGLIGLTSNRSGCISRVRRCGCSWWHWATLTAYMSEDNFMHGRSHMHCLYLNELKLLFSPIQTYQPLHSHLLPCHGECVKVHDCSFGWAGKQLMQVL